MNETQAQHQQQHVPAQDLELFVMGALAAGDAARVEAHVGACDACAGALAREARLEAMLGEVAADAAASRERPRVAPRAPSASPAARAGVAWLAVAAAAVFAIASLRGPARATSGGATASAADSSSPRDPRPDTARPAALWVCPDGADGEPCTNGVRLADASRVH